MNDEGGIPLSHVCEFCAKRTYACRATPGAWDLGERIACPACRRILREQRCERGVDEPLPNCECSRCRPVRTRPPRPERAEVAPEPDPPPPPAPEDSPRTRRYTCSCVRGEDGPDPSCPTHGEHGEPGPPALEQLARGLALESLERAVTQERGLALESLEPGQETEREIREFWDRTLAQLRRRGH